MLVRTLQVGRRQVCQRPLRTVKLRRNNSGSTQGPHKTYFQDFQQPTPPPPKQRSVLRSILWSTTCFAVGAYAYHWLVGTGFDLEDITEEQAIAMAEEVMAAGTQDVAARQAPPLDLEAATDLLQSRSGYSITPKAVAHTSQLPSNMPCEDTWSSGAFTLFGDQAKDWYEWAVFDGHAGPRTAQILKEHLPSATGMTLWREKCMEKPYKPNDTQTINAIKKAFLQLDSDIVEQSANMIKSGAPLNEVIAAGAAAFSGSCALLALYDPVRHILRVANVGDSRAVLGRYDPRSKQYIAKPMSVDQTGFNQDEVARIESEHPDEAVVDPKTGRVHGLAVSRAFGDARWKWTQDITQKAHDYFWGPRPRPKNVIKTPPYLTAEPVIMETKVNTGDHPDFLIMASDGLWDKMSSEDAVTCVQMWLEKNKPTNFLDQQKRTSWGDFFNRKAAPRVPSFAKTFDVLSDGDTYFDEDEGIMQWKVTPKHFVVEDENCGIHLIKNALGGKRRELFTGVVTVQPPWSREVRDDITVHVIFFGVDADAAIKN